MVVFNLTIYCVITPTRLPLTNDKVEYTEHVLLPKIAARPRPMGCLDRNYLLPRHVRLLNSTARGTHLRYPV